MNGKDGRPFKTRDGGVMRLEHLISGINEEMLAKIQENQKTKENLGISTEEAEHCKNGRTCSDQITVI